MIERFQGSENKRVLNDALLAQFVVNNDGAIAADLTEMVSLKEYKPGEEIIKEDSHDNDMFLILSGMVSIKVKGREQARRSAGLHVGEMALIDTSAKRSASVFALDETVVAIVSEEDFSQLASKFPVLWRRLALALAQRLRERGNLIRPKNETPRIFIGSSAEGLDIARAIQTGLAHDRCVVQVWTDDVFKASTTSIENLILTTEMSDFGVLVLGSEDQIVSRSQDFEGPRDNVIFELGLFMGGVGRSRTFIVREQGSKAKIPTDLLGLTPLEYQKGKPEDLQSRVAVACSEIRKALQKLGAK